MGREEDAGVAALAGMLLGPASKAGAHKVGWGGVQVKGEGSRLLAPTMT